MVINFNQNNMIEIGYYMTIITLYKQGESQRKIAKLVGHDRKTVRKIIKRYKEEGITEVTPMSQTKNNSKRETFFVNYYYSLYYILTS
ncbi:helix-turn-helix domain-containing protein [Candidatus Bandiella numerosa]|uniref:helix-turn-helix domain-containing protein n=1 Tax=Candidatus Bandiella numerosa TaxID=2570586 RepID=UPI00249F1F41|nr:helix-turn-helix domain-containing protein [Candidatus Bandiella numerosa]WHA04436.1 helix-turn-helix domain-containing protein [Candidatus Bandiella numerosa]